MIKERLFQKPLSGYLMLVVELVLLVGAIFAFNRASGADWLIIAIGIVCALLFLIFMAGFIIVNPNEAKVLILFGVYNGTVKENGFFWVNPFFVKKHISLRARNHNGQSVKVNDKIGNPIEIAAVIVWKVEETARAVFEVDDYIQFVHVQSEAAVRHLASSYPYDTFGEDHESEISLRGNSELVNDMLEKELRERLDRAGINIIEARISHLAYAPEIAGAMLQRQQATAVVAARRQIVEGAVGMVQMALEKLSEHEIVHLDEERKAAMISNLLVVLCGDKSASPVVNTGTLYH